MSQNVQSYIMPTYGKRDLEFIRGEGCYLFTDQNEKYLDFGGGIAVNSLGHCHPVLVEALKNQAETYGIHPIYILIQHKKIMQN